MTDRFADTQREESLQSISPNFVTYTHIYGRNRNYTG